jgi:hypothetical protein
MVTAASKADTGCIKHFYSVYIFCSSAFLILSLPPHSFPYQYTGKKAYSLNAHV